MPRGEPAAAIERQSPRAAAVAKTEVPDSPLDPNETPRLPEGEPLAIRKPVDVRGAALSVLAVVGIIWLLQAAQPVFIPFVVSGLLFYALDPLVDRLQAWKVPRALGAAIVLLSVLASVGGTIYAVTDQAVAVMEELPAGVRQLRNELRALRGQQDALDNVKEAARELDRTAGETTGQPATQGVVRVQVEEPTFRLSEYVWSGTMGAVGLLGLGLMVCFLTYFLLVADDLFKRKLVKNVGATLAKKRITVQILDEIGSQIERFLLVQLLTSVVVAVVTALALSWLGLRQAILWGLLAGLFNSIPYVGPLIVTIGLAIVAFLQFGTFGMTTTVAGVALAITTLEGWVLTPHLMGRVGQMNRMSIFAGLLFWSWVWGIWGTLLAVPITMVIKVVCDHVEELQPIGDFLAE